MQSCFAWLDSDGRYLALSDEYACLCAAHQTVNVGQWLAVGQNQSAVVDLQAMLHSARQQGISERQVPLFDGSHLYTVRIFWVAALGHFLLQLDPSPVLALDSPQSVNAAPRFKSELDRHIRAAARQQQQVALLKVGFEALEWLAETLGDAQLECLMTELAERLLSGLRSPDMLYRADSGSFLIQLSGVSSSESALRIGHRLLEHAASSLRVGSKSLHLELCIGVALAPFQAADAGELMGAVSQAFKQAIRTPQSRVQLYDPVRYRKALTLAQLPELLQPDFTCLGFLLQPLYGVHSHRAELAQLIPAFNDVPCFAEDDRTLQMLLQTAGYQAYLDAVFAFVAQTVNQLGEQARLHKLVVRLPRMVLEQPDFISYLSACRQQSGSLYSHILLEVEAIEALDYEGVLFDLDALGFALMLSGMSDHLPSIQQIKELEPALLKLDMPLVKSVQDRHRKRLAQVIELALDLEIALVAEGIESAGQRMALAQQGVRYMQGDYFGTLLDLELLQQQLILEQSLV